MNLNTNVIILSDMKRKIVNAIQLSVTECISQRVGICHFRLWFVTELDQIIWIIRYLNSWERIALFIFGIWSICDFQIIFEYSNSCHQIPNISRIFYKQDMCRKHSKNPSCRYENKGSNFPHLIWSQFSHIKFFGGLLFDLKYSVFE